MLRKLMKYFSKKDLTLPLAHVAALEKEMATQSNILSWEISWTEEPRWARVHGVTEWDTT